MEYIYRPIEFGDKEYVERLRSTKRNRATALSFPSIYTWREALGLTICRTENFISIHSRGDNGYFCPMGDKNECLQWLDNMIKTGDPFKVMYLSKEQAEAMEKYGAEISLNRDLSEYLYNSNKLALFVEKPVDNYKSRIKSFKKKYSYCSELINGRNVSKISVFLNKDNCCDMPEYERNVIENVIETFSQFDMTGVLVENGDNFAFMAGYANTEDIFTYTVFFSSKEWEHISVAICELELARLICGLFDIVDFEEDLGIEGLRKNKTLTGPDEMIDAWEAFFVPCCKGALV